MAKYRQRLAEVEAVQFSPDKKPWPKGVEKCERFGWRVATPHGDLIMSPGDWIVTDATGNVEICDPENFAVAYEQITE